MEVPCAVRKTIMHMHEENETARIEAFSDGVFAIAMTLLVIEIKVPSQESVAATGPVRCLVALWPSYLGFLTSFVAILVIWVHHHWIFALLRKHESYCRELCMAR